MENSKPTQYGKISASLSPKSKMAAKLSVKQTLNAKANVPSGTRDYEKLYNKPSIENVTLIGNKELRDFGDRSLNNSEIREIIQTVFDKGD